MEPKFIVNEENYRESPQGIYISEEFSLIYELDKNEKDIKDSFWLETILNNEKNKNIVLFYDTLTIVFNELSKSFVSFDAYTNKDQWIKREIINKPTITAKGVLQFYQGFEDDDRYSFDCHPSFEYDINFSIKINFFNDSQSEFYQIKDNLIVGIDDKKITSLIIDNVLFV